MNIKENIIIDLGNILDNNLSGEEIDYIHIICRNKGYRPIENNDKIVVSFNDKQYEIKRVK